MATGLWLTATFKFWPKCLFPEIVSEGLGIPGGAREASINAIVGTNEWMKEFLIRSYKFLHQQNNPIGKWQCISNSYLWRVLFSAPLQFFFFISAQPDLCFLFFCFSFLIWKLRCEKHWTIFQNMKDKCSSWKVSFVCSLCMKIIFKSQLITRYFLRTDCGGGTMWDIWKIRLKTSYPCLYTKKCY